MTLANMRENGVRVVVAMCQPCGREADVNVDAISETWFQKRRDAFAAAKCGSKRVNVRPAWHTARDKFGRARS
jgi:rRNA maturation protein Nop10